MRTEQQIVDQTNALARKLYSLRGLTSPEGFRFDRAIHPYAAEAWNGACEAQLLLTDTDPADALLEIEEGT